MSDYEAWLKNLVSVWRYYFSKIEGKHNEGLDGPLQINACYVISSDNILSCVIFVNDSSNEDLNVKTLCFKDLKDIADKIDNVEDYFGLPGEISSNLYDSGDLLFTQYGVMTSAALNMHRHLKNDLQESTTIKKIQSQYINLQIYGSKYLLWTLHHPIDLSNINEIKRFAQGEFDRISQSIANKEIANEECQTTSSLVTITEEKHGGYASYPYPHFFCGKPEAKKPSVALREFYTINSKLVLTRNIRKHKCWLFSDGRLVCNFKNDLEALDFMNHFYAVISRSGLPSHELPDSEMIQATIDISSGEISGGTFQVSSRNKFYHLINSNEIGDLSFVIDKKIVEKLIDIAIKDFEDPESSELALRLLSAQTLYWNGHLSESFLSAWSIVERWTEIQFKNFWGDRGKSIKQIKDMTKSWTASMEIDLLLATDLIKEDSANQIHKMRGIRNKIVHDLKRPTKEQSEEMLNLAISFSPLSKVDLQKIHRVYAK